MSFTQIAVIYLMVINILGFLVMGLDKHKAKMAERRPQMLSVLLRLWH